ncbi:MAG: OmpH family outer membrane protein [Mucilaginibacter sp.]|jgi:outer membrane protein|nr:OmpH family outer membrane protein [Mucilaginibacter sp.]
MKKLFKVALVAGCMLFMGNFAKAQSKIGYIAFDQIIQSLPAFKTVQTQLQAYQKQWTDQLQTFNNEYNTKAQAYQTGRAAMTDAVRTTKEAELTDLQKRFSELQTNAQQQVEAKTNELSKPLIDQARAAVVAVAKEKGYSYVLNSTQTDLIVSPEGDDLMPAVKVKLGIK